MIQQKKIQAGIDEIPWYATETTREARGGHRTQLQKEVKTSSAKRFNFYRNRTTGTNSQTLQLPHHQQTASKTDSTSTKGGVFCYKKF